MSDAEDQYSSNSSSFGSEAAPTDDSDSYDDLPIYNADEHEDPDKIIELLVEADDENFASSTSTASNLSFTSTTSRSSRFAGGVKVSKKKQIDPLYLQRLIDKDLRERIPIDAFKQKNIVTMVKNTVGIKCKQCGSDNVYVESKQVRSADEAMTKFYTCLNCGNKWRFD